MPAPTFGKLALLLAGLMAGLDSPLFAQNADGDASNIDIPESTARISDAKAEGPARHSRRTFLGGGLNWPGRSFGWSFLNGARMHDNDLDFPPLGGSIAETVRLHRKAARPLRLLIYHYDFVGNTSTLNSMGRQQVVSIATRLATTDQPIILQPSKSSITDGARRHVIVDLLEKLGVETADSRVVLKQIYYPRLLGTEGEQVDERRRLQQPFTGDATGGLPN